MTTTLTPSETCQLVANIIDIEPHRFDMYQWESECGTKACIAGNIAILHGDPYDGESDRDKWADQESDRDKWADRQARRLGLNPGAGDEMFYPESPLWNYHNPDSEHVRFSKVLRQLGQELEDRGENNQFINRRELYRIAEEALA